jgi:hypothetical protein
MAVLFPVAVPAQFREELRDMLVSFNRDYHREYHLPYLEGTADEALLMVPTIDIAAALVVYMEESRPVALSGFKHILQEAVLSPTCHFWDVGSRYQCRRTIKLRGADIIINSGYSYKIIKAWGEGSIQRRIKNSGLEVNVQLYQLFESLKKWFRSPEAHDSQDRPLRLGMIVKTSDGWRGWATYLLDERHAFVRPLGHAKEYVRPTSGLTRQ